MTNEDWENFTLLLEKYIEEFQKKELKKGRDFCESSKVNWINEVWKKLAELICQAANKSIPHKKIKNTSEEKQKQIIWNPRYKWIKQLRRIGRRERANLNATIGDIDQLLVNTQIGLINSNNDTEIQEIGDRWSTMVR